jgi:hypothetical protein
VTGNYGGYALVGGTVTAGATKESHDYDLDVTFYNYSDEGYIFLGGALQYSGSVYEDVYVNGTVKFAGSYKGFMQYNGFRIPVDEFGSMINIFAPCDSLARIIKGGNITYRSDGNVFDLNPYPFVREIIVDTTIVYICDRDYTN